MRRRFQRCSVSGCYNSTTAADSENVSYFRVPTEPHRAKLWYDAVGGKANSRLVVCELHFMKNYISNNHNRKRLVATAVPTLCLAPPAARDAGAPPARRGRRPLARLAPQAPPTPQTLDPNPPVKQEPPDEDDDDGEAPDIDIFVKEETTVSQKRVHEMPGPSSLSDCPVKRERPDEGETSAETPERLAELDRLVELSNAHLEPEFAKYIETKVQLQKASLSRGTKYDENLSFFALKLYHAFPQTYKLMHKPLSLPTMVQIRRLFRPLRWEANRQWGRLLRARFAGATPEQRECVVAVVRTPLRPSTAYCAPRDRLEGLHELGGARKAQVARSAVLLVARGIHARWRQPLACGLLGAGTPAYKTRFWIQSVVLELFRVGLSVRALITDFDESFVPTGPIVTVERPYFTVEDKQIYCFYDSTQLMMSFRDYFRDYNINIGGLIAKWEDIEDVHEYNTTRAYPLPTGLTTAHVIPLAAGPARRRARLAAEALAQPVAAALAAAVDLRVLDDAAHGTVQLVSAVANLHDIMHNRAFGTKPLNKGKAATGSSDIKFLNEMIARLEKMSLVDKANGQVKGDPGLLAAMRAGVHAVLALHERMRRAGAGLPMRAFNNDPLHEFLDRLIARSYGAPTSMQLFAAFKRSFVFNIMKSFRTSPEDGQLEEFLSAASKVHGVPRAPPAARAPASRVPVERWSALLRVARGRRSTPLLARHLLERCLELHGDCELARNYCCSQQLPTGLLRFMEFMSWKFATHIQNGDVWQLASPGLLAALLEMSPRGSFEAPCGCFPTHDLQVMYYRFKIRALVDYNNNRMVRIPNADFSVNLKHIDLC